jgi:hypothetical protein
MKKDSKLISSIRPIARELMRIKKQAEALGVFTNDRELLECTGCDLVEDVTCDGFLITYHRNSGSMDDSGLRFRFEVAICDLKRRSGWPALFALCLLGTGCGHVVQHIA